MTGESRYIRKYCDAVAVNNAAPEEAVQFILEDFNENTCD